MSKLEKKCKKCDASVIPGKGLCRVHYNEYEKERREQKIMSKYGTKIDSVTSWSTTIEQRLRAIEERLGMIRSTAQLPDQLPPLLPPSPDYIY
jgi:hypothetical protein